MMKQRNTHSIPAGLAMIFGIFYLLRSFSYYYGDIAFSYASVSMGVQLARYFILPHLFCVLLAVCINTFGFLQNHNRIVFAAAFAYIIAIILLPRATPFLLPGSILSLLAYFRMPAQYQKTGEIH